MKKSRKQLLGTLLAAYAVVFLFVGVNRATESLAYLPADERIRTSQAELESFSNFSRIEAQGDFDLDVRRGDTWSVVFTPLETERGGMNAVVENDRLLIEGFGHRSDQGRGAVTITLPALESLSAAFHTRVRVSGFNQDDIEIQARNGNILELNDNILGELRLETFFLNEVHLSGNTITTEQLSIGGDGTVITRQ